MVYHDLPAEEGQKKFEEMKEVPDVKALEPIQTREVAKKPKRKVVKALVPMNK
jgi:hypothetical protein